MADVEGLTIARTGPGTGYLMAANQGDSTYAIYTREGSNTYLETFQIGGACGVDEVTGSDGIDVTTTPLGPAFPAGVFVTQDDTNAPAPGNQNFKLVPLQDCGKCDTCWHAGVGFDDGDCLYHLAKPNFALDDCLAGCAAGSTPGFPPSNLLPGWQALECVAWDDSM